MATTEKSSPSLLSFLKREYKKHEQFLVRTSHNNHIQPIKDLDKLKIIAGNLVWFTRKGTYLISGWFFRNPKKEPTPTAADAEREKSRELKEALDKEERERKLKEKQLRDKINELKALEDKMKEAIEKPGE